MPWVLERLVDTLDVVGAQCQVIIAGPLPVFYDNAGMCKDLQEVRKLERHCLRKCPRVHFCDAVDVLFDKWGVHHALLDSQGLTCDGI